MEEGAGSTEQGELELEPEAVEIESEPIEGEDDNPNETARETFEKTLEEMRAAPEDEEGEPEAEAPKPVQKAKTAPKEQQNPGQFAEVPRRLSAEQREVFQKAPREMQHAIAQMVKEHEAALTRDKWQLANEKASLAEVREAVKMFGDQWAALRLTPSQAIVALGNHQRELISNPKAALVKLANQKRIDLSELAQMQRTGATGQQPQAQQDILSHPQFRGLTETVNQLQNYHYQQQLQASVSDISQQIAAIREEQDSAGNPLYPNLTEEFLQRAKPLVLALREATAKQGRNLSWNAAVKQVYWQEFGAPRADFSQVNQARFQPPNSQTRKPQARPVSQRSRSGPMGRISAIPSAKDIPDSPRDTFLQTLAEMRQGT